MLAVYIRVQLNVLGGYMYQDTLNACNGLVTVHTFYILSVLRVELLISLFLYPFV